jgi:aspartyl-tRNA(Asn)/glutamyl-tRNA(Gln) amidotransferase subunit A
MRESDPKDLYIWVCVVSGMKNYFLQAQKVRLAVRAEYDRVFRAPNVLMKTETAPPGSEEGVDVLLTPATLGSAPALEEDEAQRALAAAADSWSQDQLLVPASLAGIPALAIPVRLASPAPPGPPRSWPLAIQLIAQWGYEDTLFRLGSVLERMGSLEPVPSKKM